MTKFPPHVKWTYKYGLTYDSFEDGNDEEAVSYISTEESDAIIKKNKAEAWVKGYREATIEINRKIERLKSDNTLDLMLLSLPPKQ